MLKPQGRIFNVTLIQAHAPTHQHAGDEAEAFYKQLQSSMQNRMRLLL